MRNLSKRVIRIIKISDIEILAEKFELYPEEVNFINSIYKEEINKSFINTIT